MVCNHEVAGAEPVGSTEEIMKVKAKKLKDDNFSLSITCEFCGKPISKVSNFGMDCENDCSFKKFQESSK